MKKIIALFLISVFLHSCKKEEILTAQQIIDKAIVVSGGDAYKNVNLEFNFRGKQYNSKFTKGDFEYIRITKDSLNTIVDTYGSVKPFERIVNDKIVVIADSLSHKIKNAINSVNYFVQLPYGLNAAAVNKKFLSKTEVKEREYYKIQITFNQEGGGDDFEDVYIYWVNTKTFKVAYLAYSFAVNGGGMRFREAYNEHYIQNIRFVDYNNYKPVSNTAKLESLDALFENNELKLLSKIETENIKVN